MYSSSRPRGLRSLFRKRKRRKYKNSSGRYYCMDAYISNMEGRGHINIDTRPKGQKLYGDK